MHHLKLALIALLAVTPISNAQSKHPMTFEDMMAMKRLGETAVSPDGKWLAYSVTTVDLAKNTKTPELWIQAIAGGDPHKLEVAQPGDSGPQFSSDGKRILFLSSRTGSQQIWLADFYPATGAAGNPVQLTHNSVEPDNARWSPDSQIHRLHRRRLPRLPGHHPRRHEDRRSMQCRSRQGRRRKQGESAALHPPPLPPLEPLHRRQALPPLPRFGRERLAAEASQCAT